MSGWRWASVAVLTILAAGCGGPEGGKGEPPGAQTRPDAPVDEERVAALRKTVRARVRAMQDVAGILSRVQDRDSMRRAFDRVAAKHDEIEQASAALRSFADLPAPVLERTVQEFAAEWSAAQERNAEESRRILRDLPGGKEFLDSVAKIGTGKRP